MTGLLSDKAIAAAKEAARTRGRERIIDHLQEEMGELLQAFGKLRRGKDRAHEQVQEEIADVALMLTAAAEHFGPNETRIIADQKIPKLQRVADAEPAKD